MQKAGLTVFHNSPVGVSTADFSQWSDPATVIQRIVRGALVRLRVLIGEFKAPGSFAYGLLGHRGRSGALRPPGQDNLNLRGQDPLTLRTIRLVRAHGCS